MAYTYSKIATYTVGSGGVASIDFLNIPQTYTDLVLKLSIRSTRGGTSFTQLGIRINGVTTGYSQRYLSADGSAVGSGADTTQYFGYGSMTINSVNSTASVFSSINIYLPNYASSNFKSGSIDFVSENNATRGDSSMCAALLSNTGAVTSIAITEPNSNSNFAQYSTAHLYGIKAEL